MQRILFNLFHMFAIRKILNNKMSFDSIKKWYLKMKITKKIRFLFEQFNRYYLTLHNVYKYEYGRGKNSLISMKFYNIWTYTVYTHIYLFLVSTYYVDVLHGPMRELSIWWKTVYAFVSGHTKATPQMENVSICFIIELHCFSCAICYVN